MADPIISFSNAIDKQNYAINSAKLTQEQLQKIISLNLGSPWPQTQLNPEFSSTTGFLPSVLLQPTLQSNPVTSQEIARANLKTAVTQTYANYKFVDWRGQQLSFPPKSLTTEDRFYASKDLPKKISDLADKPHSMRDVPLIFGDGRMDYFRHGLQVLGDGRALSNLTPIDNPLSGKSEQRYESFVETPWENEDPPMFGFDIIFDSYSSPLLNGSLTDFISNYSNVSEIASKKQVYEEFKNQFQKFFRINGEMKVDKDYIAMTSIYNKIAGADISSTIHNPHKKNYLGHYVKKITGLDFLIEQNKGDTIKYTPDYKKDFITLQLREDVSMNMGVLAHLYKTLYWSKPNGKMLIPENLLRFNCIIIISECRNFQRVKKGILNNKNINIIKDNLSRYVYTLRECQFYFDKLPLSNEVDLGDQGPTIYENYEINFDFKYSSVKLERFVPNGDWGNYVGIDGGSIWKVGNKGTRNSRGTTGSQELSSPKFFTVGPDNATYMYYPNLKINGEEKPYIMNVYGPDRDKEDSFKKTESKEGDEIGNKTSGSNVGDGSVGVGGVDETTTIDSLKKQSDKVNESAKEQAEIKSIEDATSSQKKMPFGSVNAALGDASLSKITKIVGTPLNQVVANNSLSSDIVSGKFFDKMNSLKLEDTLKEIKTGGLANLSSLGEGLSGSLSGALSGGLSGIKSAIPSLDSVKTKFSSAKTQAITGFFDIRGNLKSSLTEGAAGLTTKANGLFGNLGGQAEGLLGGLTDKVKSAIPSLDSVKTKFSSAKTQAITGFFDIRGNLKSSLTEGSNKIMTSFDNAINDSNSLTDQVSKKKNDTINLVKGLLNQEVEKSKSNIGKFISVDSLKEKFTNASEIPKSSFFDIRSQMTGEKGKDTSSLNLRKNLLNNTIDKIYNTKNSSTSPIKSNTPPATSFFDLKNQLKEFLGGSLGDKLTE